MKPYRNKNIQKNTVPKTRLVQKEPVEVFCRIRPLANPNDVVCLRAQSNHVLQLLPPEIFQKNKDCVVSEYTFRYVFSETSAQQDVFTTVALPLVTDLLNGKNGLLFTYGVTSSGKTYTMTGTPEESGMLPRCLDVIFNSIKFQQTSKFVFKPNKQNGFEIQSTPDAILEQQKELGRVNQKTPKIRRRNPIEWNQRMVDTHLVEIDPAEYVYTVFVSFVEIYNNYIYDLLDEGLFDVNKGRPPQSRALREDFNRNMYVSETTEVEVKSADEAFEVFWRGQQRRKVAHTALNTESSRSHSVFVIRVVQAVWNASNDDVDVSTLPTVSQLSLVDLAGSERTMRTRNVGSRLKEAGSINNSLMVLRQCIEMLRDKQQNPVTSATKIVPYRDNKLTMLFKSFFEGEGRVRMVVCANPGINEFDETVQAMKFAELTQDVLIPRQVKRPPPPVPPKMPKMDTAIPLILGPPFPDVVLNCPDDAVTLKTLEHFMVARLNYRTEALRMFAEKQSEFREQLVQTESENNIMRQQLRTMQMDLNHRMEQLGTVERRCAKSEQSTEGLQRKVNDLEREKRNLQSQLRERERRINVTKVNQLKLESEMKDQLQLERDRMNRMMERRLAAKEAELQAKMCLSEERMRMLRDILNSGEDWAWTEDQVFHNMASSTSEPHLHQKTAPPTPRSQSTRDANSRSDPKLAGSKTPVRTGVPAANPRHRRSASAGCDKWLEHIPAGSVETGTIFQPIIKRKKSVSKLESKDLVESSKYVLTHQEAKEGTGEVKTQLYKGNVVPSCSGGAQVIFDDVEILKQTSPPHGYMLRKRSAEQLQQGSQDDGRCRPAIENKAPAQFKKARV